MLQPGTTGGGGAHWCDSLIIGENLEILYTDCASFPGFVCCVFCNKKLAEIHAMTISRKNSSKECIKVFSNMFLKNFNRFVFWMKISNFRSQCVVSLLSWEVGQSWELDWANTALESDSWVSVYCIACLLSTNLSGFNQNLLVLTFERRSFLCNFLGNLSDLELVNKV